MASSSSSLSVAVLLVGTLTNGQNTLPEDSCSFHDGSSVLNVVLTRSEPGKDCSVGSERLVDEVKVAQEKTNELGSVFLQLQSMVLRLMEANHNLTERLRLTENELRSTKQALALHNGVSLGCPDGYPVFNEHASSCYVFVRRDMNWHDAQGFCSSTGGHLVAVDDNDEQEFLLAHIRSSTDLSGKHFWTGGNDIAEENDWIWAGINQRFNYTQWLKYPHADGGVVQQPDNHDNEEHCVHLFYLHDYEWNDMYCGYEYYFICEYKLLV